jgi:TolB protein
VPEVTRIAAAGVLIVGLAGVTCGRESAATADHAASAVPGRPPEARVEVPAGEVPATVAPFPQGLSGTLAFQSDRGGRTKIYTLDLASGRAAALTTDQRYHDENPRWSPDGRQILFKSNRAHYGASAEGGTPDYDLYVMQADGSGVRRLTTDPANENEASWLPDGKSVVYSSDKDSRGDLYRLWLADGRVERLTRHFVGRAIMPAVSPDGARVAFAAQSLNRGQFWLYQVHLLDLAAGKSAALGATGGSCWPAWGPGGRLAYVLLDTEPSAIEAIEVASGARRRLVADRRMWSYYPDWSPDGRTIAFSVSPAHHEGEDWDLALVAADGSAGYVKLTTGRGNDRLPDWKP